MKGQLGIKLAYEIGMKGSNDKKRAYIISKFLNELVNEPRCIKQVIEIQVKLRSCAQQMRLIHSGSIMHRLKNSQGLYKLSKFSLEALNHAQVSHQQGFVQVVKPHGDQVRPNPILKL